MNRAAAELRKTTLPAAKTLDMLLDRDMAVNGDSTGELVSNIIPVQGDIVRTFAHAAMLWAATTLGYCAYLTQVHQATPTLNMTLLLGLLSSTLSFVWLALLGLPWLRVALKRQVQNQWVPDNPYLRCYLIRWIGDDSDDPAFVKAALHKERMHVKVKQANRELKESVVRKIRDHSEMSLLSRMLFLRAAARVQWFVILMTFLATLPVCATHRFQVSRKPWRLPAGEEDEISSHRKISKRKIPIHPRAALRRRGPKTHRRFVREMSVHADSFPGEHRWRKAHAQAGEAPLSESWVYNPDGPPTFDDSGVAYYRHINQLKPGCRRTKSMRELSPSLTKFSQAYYERFGHAPHILLPSACHYLLSPS